jgi:flagellar protein FliS
MNAYAKSANAYLAQRILGTNPEQQAALIMEAGQLHLGKAIRALEQADPAAATRSYIRVSEVIMEATLRLDLDNGGEAAQSLNKLYGHWSSEIMAAARTKDTARLEAVVRGMGEIRQAWEQLHDMKAGSQKVQTFLLGDQVG